MDKGVILLSAHFGNFLLQVIALSKKGYHLNIFTGIPGLNKVFNRLFNRFGLKIIEYKDNGVPCFPIRPAIKCVRKNEIIVMLFDNEPDFLEQDPIIINFLNHPVPTTKASAFIALKTKASLLPMFIIREDRDYHKIVIHPPLKVEISRNMRRNILLISAKFSKILESYVKKYPEWYYWHDQVRWHFPFQSLEA